MTAGMAWTLVAILGAALIIVWAAYRRAKDDAERSKRAFLSITGHELRTPLTVIRGLSQTLTSRWSQLKDEQKEPLVQNIASQAETLEHLVERILYGGELETGIAGSPQPRPTDVSGIMSELLHSYRANWKLHSFTLEAEDNIQAQSDPRFLKQIMRHVLDNAVKYSPEGGAIDVAISNGKKKIKISVEDAGVGLPPNRRKIFDKFVQGEAIDTRELDRGGVGMGLFLARSQVETMGGKIKAEPRSPKGSRFVVTLPKAP